jgi:hypothetical protein
VAAVGKPEENRLLASPKRTSKENIKMDFKICGIGWDGVLD